MSFLSRLFGQKKDGPFEHQYPNGQLKSKGTYSNGKLDGPYESYHQNGQLQQKGTYNMGDKCGEWMFEAETGTRTRAFVSYPPCFPNLADGS